MKIVIEITSETTDHDLNRIANAVNSLTEKPNEDAENQKIETKKAQKAERVSEKHTDVESSEETGQTGKDIEKKIQPKSDRPTSALSDDTVEDSSSGSEEAHQIDYDTLKKKVLDAKANGLDFEGAIERGTNGLSRKLIPIKSETHLFGAIYAELEKLFRDAEGA